MTTMFEAVDKNYKMAMQYKYTWNTLQNFGQFRDKRIWRNFTYLIDWMEEKFPKKKFFEIIGKSYDLEDEILYRIEKTDQSGKSNEAWLMSDIFRHVENTEKEKNPIEKFMGVVEFTKIKEGKYEGEIQDWTPEDGIPTDIRIVVYEDKEMKTKRRYEVEHNWNRKWEKGDWKNDTDFNKFKKKWATLKEKKKIPGWYRFNPENPENPDEGHNSVKAWDPSIFDFLKGQKWNKKISEIDGKNQYEEQSKFVVDCSDLLGIGGEAVVIQKSIKEKKAGEVTDDREYEALKIIPIMKHNFEEGKIKEMHDRVTARQEKVDPEIIQFQTRNREGRIPRQDSNTISDRIDALQPAGQKEAEFTKTYLQAAENHEMTDQDVELAENHGAQFRHESLMEYSNMQLDFIKVFGTKVFVMVIGK